MSKTRAAKTQSANEEIRRLRAQLAAAERERDEAREMLEGSVTDATFAAWHESADLRVVELTDERDAALKERDEARAELAHEREHLAAVMRDANEARAELADEKMKSAQCEVLPKPKRKTGARK